MMKLRRPLLFVIACLAVLISFLSTGLALTAEQVYSNVKNSIYTLYGVDFRTKKAVARGSAVAVTANILATNCHVALSGNFLVVKSNAANKVARILYKDEKQDLCLVDVPGVTFQPVAIRDSHLVQIGEIVYAVGNPQGTEKTLSQGIISNRHMVDGGVWLQTDATISFGSSGGGLFDDKGQLIGITAKMGGNFGFATPTEWILAVLNPKKSMGTAAPIQQDNAAAAELGKPANATSRYASLKNLGSFGVDGVGLYRNNHECFIVMPGKDLDGHPRGLAMWNPRFSTKMIIFSSALSIQEALDLLVRSVAEGKVEKNRDYESDSVLYLNGRSYPLSGTSSPREHYAYFVVRFSEDPFTTVQAVPEFSVQFRDVDPRIGDAKVIYLMRGFAEALASYKKQCPESKESH